MKILLPLFFMAVPIMGQISFEVEVWPILKERCVECHRKAYEEDGKLKKPKSGLRLDGSWHILKGSDDGPVVVAGRPDASTLYHHISLPSGDDDIMPPKGEPLNNKEIKVIHRWIRDGAKFGRWKGATDGVVETVEKEAYVPQHVRYFQNLEKGLEPLPEALLKQLSKSSTASIRRLHPESPLVDVGFFTTPNLVEDKHLSRLAGLREHVVKLSIGRSQVTDQSLGLLGQFSRVSHLNLRETSITDAGLQKISGLKNLVYLNLYGTSISDTGLRALEKCRNLKKLYLAGTSVTETGIRRLQKRIEGLQVVH